METWKLSVEEWKKIIYILESLNIPTKILFSNVSGHRRTNLYNRAKRLRRKKISSTHRGIIPRTIRRITNACKGKSDDTVIKINITQNLCNLIRPQAPPS
jgi:hypothetical protein